MQSLHELKTVLQSDLGFHIYPNGHISRYHLFLSGLVSDRVGDTLIPRKNADPNTDPFKWDEEKECHLQGDL